VYAVKITQYICSRYPFCTRVWPPMNGIVKPFALYTLGYFYRFTKIITYAYRNPIFPLSHDSSLSLFARKCLYLCQVVYNDRLFNFCRHLLRDTFLDKDMSKWLPKVINFSLTFVSIIILKTTTNFTLTYTYDDNRIYQRQIFI